MIPPLFRSKSVKMKDATEDRGRDLLWVLPASLILHALIIALLVYSPPKPFQPPQEEQAVNVELVPPPDQPKPKPPPEPPPKDLKAEKPPEPKVEKPPEPKVEKPAPPEKQPPKPAGIEVLKPVFQFGEKDTGPRKSPDGGSAQDNTPSPGKVDETKPPVGAKDPENKPAAPSNAEAQADAAKDAEKKAASTQDADKQDADKQDADKQEADKQEADKQEAAKQENEVHDADKQTAPAPTPLASAGSDGEIELPTSAEAPQPRPANAPKSMFAKVSKPKNGSASKPNSTDVAASQGYSGLPGVRKLNSQGATGDAFATTAMAGLPRDQRAAKLCASTLNEQLMEASYYPYLLPLVPLKSGNIVDVPDIAFSTRTTWYNLGFRCEVDSDATRVLNFAFNVGTEIPRDEWARLGLPMLY
jgi:hypothetical protein